MLAIGLGLDDQDAIHVAFVVAYAALTAGCVFSIGYWVSSDFIEGLRRKAKWAKKPQKKKDTKRRYLTRQYGAITGIGLIFAIFMHYGVKIEAAKRLSTFTGTLVPANDPFIPACNGATDGEAILLAGTAAYKFARWPATVLTVRGQKRIVLDRNKGGTITLTADVYSPDGKILASVLKNSFNVNRNNIFRMERPDDSTLKIIDQWNETALSIRYLNSKELQFDAKLYYPGTGYVTAFDRIQMMCIDLGHSGAGLFAVN